MLPFRFLLHGPMIHHAVPDRLHQQFTVPQLYATDEYGLDQQGNTNCTDRVCNVTDCTHMMQLVLCTVSPACDYD